MLSSKIAAALNEQINKEFYSAYLYLAMAAWADGKDFPGMAHWLRMQTQEELGHGMRLLEFLSDRGGTVALAAIDAPPAEFGSALELFEEVLTHERRVTAMIGALTELAVQEKAYMTQAQLVWFINEQVEEESTAELLVAQIKMAGADSAAMLMLDRELAARPTPAIVTGAADAQA